jgi:hypothetical protein
VNVPRQEATTAGCGARHDRSALTSWKTVSGYNVFADGGFRSGPASKSTRVSALVIKRRAFGCRLTSGSFAIIYDGNTEDVRTVLINNLNGVKREVVLLVSDQRIPLFDEHELTPVRHELGAVT